LLLSVFFPCTVVVPKYVSAAVHGPLALSLASISTLTVMLVTAGSMRQSACTDPLMFVPVSPCVVVSSTTEPVPLKVSVTRVKAVADPPPSLASMLYVVCPVYWMVVAPFTDHTNRSAPLGSELLVLFIFSPNGTVVFWLMPM
jgi:hypothetical protein